LINKEENVAYLASGPRGLLILDISDYSNIKLLSKTSLDLYSSESITVSKDEELAVLGLRFYGFYILDIRDKTSPKVIYKYITYG